MTRPRASQTPGAPVPSFVDTLAAAAAKPGRKGERTRARIRWAAAAALMEQSYAMVSVEDICARAAVSRTAFYVYWPSKPDLVRDVLIEFQRSVQAVREGPREGQGPLASIQAANRAFVAFVRLNAPLMERIRELRDELPELIAERQRVNHAWAARIVAAAKRAGVALPERSLGLRAHALIFMAEDFLREVHVIGNPNLASFADDDEATVEELSDVWFRALYPR